MSRAPGCRLIHHGRDQSASSWRVTFAEHRAATSCGELPGCLQQRHEAWCADPCVREEEGADAMWCTCDCASTAVTQLPPVYTRRCGVTRPWFLGAWACQPCVKERAKQERCHRAQADGACAVCGAHTGSGREIRRCMHNVCDPNLTLPVLRGALVRIVRGLADPRECLGGPIGCVLGWSPAAKTPGICLERHVTLGRIGARISSRYFATDMFGQPG